jgi:hypothetical protein
MNQKEYGELQDLNKNLKTLNTTAKAQLELQKKVTSNTNKNTMQYEMVKAINSIADSLAALTVEVKKLSNK